MGNRTKRAGQLPKQMEKSTRNGRSNLRVRSGLESGEGESLGAITVVRGEEGGKLVCSLILTS